MEVKPDLLRELLEMGFSEARAARGLHFSGNSTLEGAINWLAEHEKDADIDEPLLVPKVRQLASMHDTARPRSARNARYSMRDHRVVGLSIMTS